MAADFGSVWTTDSCKVIATKGNLLQIIYPLSGGGYKLGWVSTEGIPKPDPLPDQVDIPGPVAEGIFDGKSIVVMAPNKITFNSDEHISAGDVCIIKDVNRTTGYCTVTYPSGSTDVFATGAKTKDKTVAMTEFVEYQPDFKTQKLTTDVKVDVYPTATLQSYGRTWYLDAGDEYHTCARSSGGATEVLYYCTHGAHQGYWKLGWVDLPYYWLDLNGWLDGAAKGDLGAYGAADVYVNGNKLAVNARDFNSANGTFPRGSSYEIKDVVAAAGYAYNGVHSGSLSGTLKSNTSVSLDFSKDPSYCSAIRIKQNPNKLQYLEGDEFDPTGLLIDAVAIDGSGSDVTSKCTLSGYDPTPGVKAVVVSYSGKTTSFTVVVSEKSPESIAVNSLPTKTAYEIGEELDLAGIEVTVRYNNGTSAVIEDFDAGVEEDAMLTPGTKTVPVSYSHNGTEVSTSFEITVVSSSVATVGDINGDGSVNNKDLTRLFQYLSDWDVGVVEENLDTNGDGSVNNKDVTRLFQYLSDWDVELHGGTN